LKILHLSSERTWRGGEQQISYLMGVLRSHGVECLLAARSGSEMARRHPEAICFPFKGEWDLYTAWRIKKLAEIEKVDVVHAHTGHGHTLAVLAATFGMKAPIVVSKRTDYPVKDNRFSKWKFNHPAVKRYLCVSDKIREILQKDLKHPDIAHTVYSGIDTSRFPPQPTVDIRSLAGLPEDSRVMVSTAAISPQKDYATFVKVAEHTKIHHPQLHYVVCGEGPSEGDIRALVKEKKLESHIHFIGFRKDLTSFLGSADGFLITSKEEGLGTSILDAFAVGLPVVATAAGGIPEIVRHGKTGLLAEVGDAAMLATHVENTVFLAGNLKAELIHNARGLAEEFSFRRTGEKTLAIYTSITT
jgi:glycosyltransferase involved in cell wall biosynthesis